jgi:hypothetical protein
VHNTEHHAGCLKPAPPRPLAARPLGGNKSGRAVSGRWAAEKPGVMGACAWQVGGRAAQQMGAQGLQHEARPQGVKIVGIVKQ